MFGSRISILIILLGVLAGPGLALPGLTQPVEAAEVTARTCLNRTEQRAAVAANKAVPLAAAIKSLHERGIRAEVVRAELCNRGEKLVYVLTLLARNGKVTRATVDAANGEPMTGQ